MLLLSYFEFIHSNINGIVFWSIGILSAVLIAGGSGSRWANIAHSILHGAYDKIPDIPIKYTKAGFGKGSRRFLDWLDWFKPQSWIYEHNVLHHYHLGEKSDPDNVENNLQWLINSNIPMGIRYLIIFILACTWKFTYYVPLTIKILKEKEQNTPKNSENHYNPFTKYGKIFWFQYILPYFTIRFIVTPLIFLPFGVNAAMNSLLILILAECFANINSFIVILPNHAAADIYRFNGAYKSKGDFYLRQIIGTVNYKTGFELLDFLHGWLNYQIEHHLFPNLTLSQHKVVQPYVKELCKKYNLEYREENIFKRSILTLSVLVGKTKPNIID